MAYGNEIFWGIGMVVMIPVIMGLVGDLYSETFSESDIEDNYPEFIVNIVNFLDTFTFGWVSNVFLGYSVFPWYINTFIVAMPLILIIRGVLSV